jgi:ABC-2 type transport system permease protein
VLSVARKALWDARWQVVGYGLTLLSMAALTAGTWPSFRDELALIEIPAAIRAFIGGDELSFATGAGYLNARYFSWTILLLLVFAITQGTGAIAGEEGAGTMDLLLALPVRRANLVLARTAAFLVSTAIIILIGYLGFVLTVPFIDIDVTLWDTFVASANMIFVTIAFFGLSLWLGAVAPTRAHAIAVAIGLLTAAYFSDVIAVGISSLDWLRYASPFYYYGRGLPLVHGVNWWHAALLTGIGAGFSLLAIRTFDHRDVTIGGATSMTLRQLAQRIAGAN